MNECIHKYISINNQIKLASSFNEDDLTYNFSFYEVIRIINNIFLFLEDHLERLCCSLELHNNIYKPDYKLIKNSLLKYKSNINIKEGNVKLLINYRTDTTYQIYIYQIKHYYPSSEEYLNGIKTGLLKGERQNPNSKFVNHEIKSLVNKEFLKQKVFELLLVNKEECITEGSRSNIFFIQNNNLFSAPSKDILPGITSKYILKIAKKQNIPFFEIPVILSDIEKYDSVFITGTSIKVLPVDSINKTKFNTNNYLLKRLMKFYENEVEIYLQQSQS